MITDQAEAWDRNLDHLFTTIGHHFGRVEPRRRMRDYVRGWSLRGLSPRKARFVRSGRVTIGSGGSGVTYDPVECTRIYVLNMFK
ncbi:hypothetical protein [Streptomyces sp. NPDC048603]|uniref:hypothetical protein n=1 Tax=Streptomyces sp. NPDC048603 TaxID=3365577 RepID=UPI003719882F